MIAARRRHLINGSLPTRTPYAEQVERHDGWLDSALLAAWGRVSAHLLSRFERGRLDCLVQRVEDEEKSVAALTDPALLKAADDLRSRLAVAGTQPAELARAFALAREATRRHVGLRHFPVQLLGGAAMMGGALAEMEAGEGKTITALLPAVTAALMGRPVHVVTVNDYLARRDAEQLRPVYAALGLSTGLVENGQEPRERQQAYARDITYCTNKELVFDYLRDRLALGVRRGRARLLVDELFKTDLAGQSQRLLLRGLHFAIVDEADSVLIDEARTPLILSGTHGDADSDAELYKNALQVARRLMTGGDFKIQAGEKTIRLTPHGEQVVVELTAKLPGLLSIRRARDELVQQALAALHLFRRDVQYIVADNKVQIVDEFTGRVMPDRSWERGIHQLIEAKENCMITQRRQTLARITYQRFFRRYRHLCGMTGTAIEAAGELRAVYGLRVIRIPTNRALQRTKVGTRMFPTAGQKWNAVVEAVNAVSHQGRAVLIGTRSVEASERVGELLRKSGLNPVILNARQDRLEADIVAEAGQPGRITVATNMAGRGTDIQLHRDVREAGGLHVILTEYHESARIDRQLFGRSGRQGDPGSYESIVALDDELFQRFAGRLALRAAAGALRRSDRVQAAIAIGLRRVCQSAAERLHAGTRRFTLADDQRFNQMLGFAGQE